MKHENKYINSTAVINRFLSKLKLRILADKKRLPFQEFDIFGWNITFVILMKMIIK